jgi:hypothetical protein
VGGAHGRYLGCACYKRGLCPCKTWLPRKLAEVALLGTVGDRIFRQPEWLEAVTLEARRAWEEGRRRQPTALGEVERKLSVVEQSIERLVDAFERAAGDADELSERLLLRQAEKRQL